MIYEDDDHNAIEVVEHPNGLTLTASDKHRAITVTLDHDAAARIAAVLDPLDPDVAAMRAQLAAADKRVEAHRAEISRLTDKVQRLQAAPSPKAPEPDDLQRWATRMAPTLDATGWAEVQAVIDYADPTSNVCGYNCKGSWVGQYVDAPPSTTLERARALTAARTPEPTAAPLCPGCEQPIIGDIPQPEEPGDKPWHQHCADEADQRAAAAPLPEPDDEPVPLEDVRQDADPGTLVCLTLGDYQHALTEAEANGKSIGESLGHREGLRQASAVVASRFKAELAALADDPTTPAAAPHGAGPETEHELKTWPAYFEAVTTGLKTFEVRRDDRGFMAGDVLLLREWDPGTERYTDRKARRRVMYVLRGSDMLREGFVVLALDRATRAAPSAPQDDEDDEPDAKAAEYAAMYDQAADEVERLQEENGALRAQLASAPQGGPAGPRGDDALLTCAHGCGETPHRFRPSPEAGPHWRCSECGDITPALKVRTMGGVIDQRALIAERFGDDGPTAASPPHGEQDDDRFARAASDAWDCSRQSTSAWDVLSWETQDAWRCVARAVLRAGAPLASADGAREGGTDAT